MAPQAFFLDFMWSGVEPSIRTPNGTAIVKVNGPLEHHASWCWDSYERIVGAVEACMTGQDLAAAHEQANWWREDFEPLDASACVPAQRVVIRIDSPGGEAAGTMAAHRKLVALRERYGVPLFAYADEMAASAAYAIASAAQELWTPDTGVIGSIGVIATLFDRTAQNEKDGLLIELITSGEFKADGHADRPITDGIRQRMQEKVDKIASRFFRIVADARGVGPGAIADLEAATFLGQDAVKAGIADGVADWDEFLELIEGPQFETALSA
jgi:ATP-dependent protease ClpP protease subunit